MVHNEVERRRKVKINNWIYRLGDLLPGCSDDKKISKNGILERAVVYLKELQENNDKLLHGHCTEVQVSEFQRMKERIQELELRNSELTRIVETSGVSVDLDTLWQQRGKYSQKIEPENVAGLFACKGKAIPSSVDKKTKPLLPKSQDTTLPDCANNTSIVNISEGGAFPLQQNATLHPLVASKQELMVENPNSRPMSITLQLQSKPASSHNTVECTSVSLAPSNSVTAVTQALSSVPIMSTSQHSSGSQQLLQQLPVLNYGNTVNIFPGLSGQSQPMIIINEQGIPLLQNLIPGQMILQPGSGQPMALSNNSNMQQNSLIPTKHTNNVVAVTNDLNSNGNGTLLLSTLQPSSALPTGIASSQIIVNAGIGQTLLPTTLSGQNTGQLMLNPTLSQPYFPSNVAATCAGFGNSCPVALSSNASNAPCIQTETLSSHSAALPATNSQAFFQSPSINGSAHVLPPSCTGQINKVESTHLAGSLLGKGTINNQVVFGCSSTAALAPLQITVPHSSALIMRNGSRPVVQSPAPILAQESGLATQLLNQTTCIPMQQNPVQIMPQPNVGNGSQAMSVNHATGAPSLPSALLLPNGQIIPVVSQPSLLYPASTPVNGSLLMTSSSPTAVFQSGVTNTQQFKPIISKETIKNTATSHGPLRPHTTTPIVCSSAHKMDMQSINTNTVLFPNQNEACPSTTTIDVTAGLKKHARKCHRAIKPKPTSPAVERSSESNPEPMTIVTNDALCSEEMTAAKSNEPTKSKAEMVPPGKPVFATISSSITPASKRFDHTTDILAKATESIFANSISEASPVTSLYGCETSTFCSHGTETAGSCERSMKSIEALESFRRDSTNDSKDNVEVPSSDIFTDLENVYENAEKDMPTLEPVSPLGKMTPATSNTSTNDDSRHEKHAPQLSLMITDHPVSNELEGVSKRNEELKSDLTPNKRQKLEAKVDGVACSKESTTNLPPATQSLNFLSISQLTNSNFAMENNLSNDNSPLSSISPLLASPAKSINSESFMPASVSQHPTSASSLMISPSVSEITVPCSGSHEIVNIMSSCDGALAKGGMGRQENLVTAKAPSSASCTIKLPMKVGEHVTTSAVVSAAANVGITSSSMFSSTRNSYTQSVASLIAASEASITQQTSSVMQGSCSSLAHFPPMHPSRSSGVGQGLGLLPSSLNTQNNLYVSVTPMSSAETSELTHSLTTTCSNGFDLGTSSPSAGSLTVNISNGTSQQNIATGNNLNLTNTLQNHSFAMPDLIQVNSSKNNAGFNNVGVHLTSTIGHDGQCASEPTEISNDVISNVPSFNFGLFGQQAAGPSHQPSATQISAQGMVRPFSQNFFQQHGASVMMPPQPNVNSLAVGKNKNTPPAQRNNETAILQPTNVTPNQGASIGHVRGACQPANHSTTAHAITSNQSLSNADSTLSFSMHRVSSATSNYSAESLIGQAAYSGQKQPMSHAASRPCLSYSAESLIQSQTDRTPQCTTGLSHHPGGVISNVSTSSYVNAVNPASLPYSSTPSTSKRFNSTCSITNFHSSLNNKTPCTHMHQHGNMPFSFSLSQTNNQASNMQQPHLATAYPNMLPHYSSNFPSRGSKPSSAGQAPPVFRQENNEGNNGMHVQNCAGYTPNSFNSFSGTTDRSPNNNDSVTNSAILSDPNKLSQEKNKSKQENHVKSNVKSSKHSVQNKKKGYSIEEVNLSNSIFETNRSVTPYFTIPNLSPPRNEAPTYLTAPNLFTSQRPPICTNATQQNKTSYDPLFSSRSQTGLNLNFQAPAFGVNQIHGNTSNVGNSNNVTNFNLSNIFPDINTSTDNLPPMKFHSTNSVLPNDVQHHQPSTLYNRPVLPNGMSINGFLTHNPHGFDGRPSVTMPINNSVAPTFHGHSHTPSFSNVIPTLNFPMHEH